MRTWILVGDSAKARLFAWDKPGEAPALVEELLHPQSQAKGQELYTDQPAMESGELPKDAEGKRFANDLAKHLEKQLAARKFDQLILVSPPGFLGALRGSFSSQLSERVVASIPKDYTRLRPNDLMERIQARAE
jgi:protein required for attachment to host cells